MIFDTHNRMFCRTAARCEDTPSKQLPISPQVSVFGAVLMCILWGARLVLKFSQTIEGASRDNA